MMKRYDFEYYEVYESYDRSYNTVARFSNYAAASDLASRSPYTACNNKPQRYSIAIFDSIEDYDASKAETIREVALAKLSDAEKKALGLK
jgi:hypothetical protein